MNRTNDNDILRNENWQHLYADVPDCVVNGMNYAFRRIHSAELQKKRIIRIVACAACICAAIGVGTVALRNRPAQNIPDTVAPQIAETVSLAADDPVLTSSEDRYFHRYGECPDAEGNAVEVKLVTALEFEKTPCPVCCANVHIDQ